MISIVTCSVSEKNFLQFARSVGDTIGVPHEVIRIDNRKNEYNICSAYNKGKSLCRFEIICFIHEDVVFKTRDWGGLLQQVMADPTIGLAGIFGACYVGSFAEDTVDRKECIGQVIEGSDIYKTPVNVSRFQCGSVAEVVAIDGVFMATRKEIIDRLLFPEDVLKGFHGYDFDISMQIRQTHKVVVTRDLFLAHASMGHYGKPYFDAIRTISEKWKSQLPAYLPQYSRDEADRLILKSVSVFCRKSTGKISFLKNHLKALQYVAGKKVLFKWIFMLLGNTATRNPVNG